MATWKRICDLNKYDFGSYPSMRNTKDFRKQFFSFFERDGFLKMFDRYRQSVKSGKRINIYDRQMNYLVCKYHKWSNYPNLNQVTNIGFDVDASNTFMDPNSEYAKQHTRPRYEFKEIIHPSEVFTEETKKCKLFKIRLLVKFSL